MSNEARCKCGALIERNRRGHSSECADCVWKRRDRMKEATRLSSYAVYARDERSGALGVEQPYASHTGLRDLDPAAGRIHRAGHYLGGTAFVEASAVGSMATASRSFEDGASVKRKSRIVAELEKLLGEQRTSLGDMTASRDILMLMLFEQFKKMNCVCRLASFIGGPLPCGTCRIESVLRKAKEIAK